ncbi:MAG: CcmD family protein [Flavobacteriales bacterium]|nr:MAG: CcmD family protein [Flavobacteriales bacterium]
MKIKKVFSILLVLFSFVTLHAQGTTEMADVLRASGKIYVVVAVLVMIFIGIVIYLISIDRKLSKLEKQQAEEK